MERSSSDPARRSHFERWPADPRAPCGATTAGHPVLRDFDVLWHRLCYCALSERHSISNDADADDANDADDADDADADDADDADDAGGGDDADHDDHGGGLDDDDDDDDDDNHH